MRMDVREDDDQGPTRVVVWSDGSQTDAGVIVASLVAAAVLVGSVATSTVRTGLVRRIAIVVAVVSGTYTAMFGAGFGMALVLRAVTKNVALEDDQSE